MCGNCNDPFHGLDDDLGDIFSGPISAADREAGYNTAAAEAERLEKQTFTEACRSCNGTGRWMSRSGFSSGSCFKCKGTGRLSFKTSPAQRAKASDKRAGNAQQARIDLQDKRAAWVAANPADFAWIKAKEESFDFAHAMMETFLRYGCLTERQHETVTRLRLADAERQAARKAEAAQRAANAPAVNVAAIEQAFAHAQSKGIKRPKMRLVGFKFSLAPATGRNAGALYVVRVEDDQYLGKIQDGKFTRVRECDDATEAAIVSVASDPHNAAIAYGQRTGNCAICGRELTNHASIDLGIGPICAERYGWA